MIDLLIIHGDVFTMTGDGVGYMEDGAVAIDGNKIVAVGPSRELAKEYEAERIIDASMKAVLPGLIDGHVHSVIATLRGVAQDGPNWHEGIDPFLNHITADAIQAGAQLSAIEAIRAGTTTIGDYGPGITFVAPFYEKAGIRAALSGLISEIAPIESEIGSDDLYPFEPSIGEVRLMENLELVEKWHGAAGGRITTMFGPQGPDYCSAELLVRVRKAAEKYDVRIHHHLHQSEREIAQVQRRHGKRPLELIKELGYLGNRLLAAHLILCTDDEVTELARSGASMAFCPSSQLICEHPIIPPADIFSHAGGNVCLGTDETPTNNGVNLFSEFKQATLLLKMRREDATEMPAWKVLRMATIEGARALGLGDEIGSLESGKKADIIMIDLKRPGMIPVLRQPVRNIVPNLVLSARGDEVSVSIIDGKVIYENGEILTIDEDESLAYAQRSAEEVCENASMEVRKRNTPQFQLTQSGRY
jgi:5-methylthioadenosine/S-adenosylhomocysteine deaminase